MQAMRRYVLRLCDAVRYEQREIDVLLKEIYLGTTQQEKALSRLLGECAKQHKKRPGQLRAIFAEQSGKMAAFGVLSREDTEPFESVLGELGHCGLAEQLRLIEAADERLRRREEILRREGVQRSRLVASLGLCCGAAAFLLLI